MMACGRQDIDARQLQAPQVNEPQLSLTGASDKVVFVLVHGGGPQFAVTLKKLQQFLTEDGVPASRIYMPTYDHKTSTAVMSVVVGNQIKEIVQQHGEDVELHVWTHSLGNYIAMRALATANLSQYVAKYIGLAGVAFGQNSKPRFCTRVTCPPYMDEMTPYKGAFIEDFWDTYSAEILQWDHCALYSRSDRRVKDPYDSGVIADGTGYEVDGVSHLGFARSRRSYQLVKQYCYD